MPLDNFSASHYEPGLLASHLEDKKFINEKPLEIEQGIRLPPQSVISIPAGSRNAANAIIVSVEAQGLGNGVEDVKLYHKGKVVVADAVVNSRQETVDKLIKKQ